MLWFNNNKQKQSNENIACKIDRFQVEKWYGKSYVIEDKKEGEIILKVMTDDKDWNKKIASEMLDIVKNHYCFSKK